MRSPPRISISETAPMRRTFPFLILSALCALTGAGGSAAAQRLPSDYPYQPLPFTHVRIADRFWGPRLETNRSVTIPAAFALCEKTGRIRNFESADSVVARQIPKGEFCSRYGFDDSDVYKIIEGAAYTLQTNRDAALEAYLDTLIGKIAAAQESDGYLYTMRTTDPEKSWAKERWVNDRANGSHELYNLGHLYEAAIAHFAATGKRTLLAVALKSADLLCRTFGPDKMHTVPGHQVIEIGLVKLYRRTGEKKYLDLARFFLDERGRGAPTGGEYNQDHLPVVEQKEAVGHAVRACYMYAGMADVAALTQDRACLAAIDRIWEDVVGSKYYITGGVGAAGDWEGFGPRYALPNLTAYNETCASIAMVYWNHRMFLLHGDAKYIDVLERTLYNGVLPGIALDGRSFFYPNPLQSSGDYKRSEWFACACCPSNVTRFIASVPGYIYAQRAESLFVNLYIGGRAEITLAGGAMQIAQETEYPWNGRVKITLLPRAPLRCAVALRIPGWAMNAPVPGDLYRYTKRHDALPAIRINGKSLPCKPSRGYAVFDRTWKMNDVVEIDFPMPVRKILARDSVADDRGKICLQRGPILYCAEQIDNAAPVDSFLVPDATPFTASHDDRLLNGVTLLQGNALRLAPDERTGIVEKVSAPLRLVPYYAWCHRGSGKMNVWFYGERMLFPPELRPPGTLFLDSIRVSIPRIAGQSVSYATGDPRKKESWLPYDAPILIDRQTTLRAVATAAGGERSDTVRGVYTPAVLHPFLPVPEHHAGLAYDYFEDTLSALKGHRWLRPIKSGSIGNYDAAALRERKDYYAIRFEGYVFVPADGVYTFSILSDDGSIFSVDGETLIAHDGIHGAEERSGQIALQKGYHRLHLDYFERNGAEALKVEWAGPGFPRQPIPDSALSH